MSDTVAIIGQLGVVIDVQVAGADYPYCFNFIREHQAGYPRLSLRQFRD